MSAKKPWEMDWPDEKEKKPWEMDWDDEASPAVDLVSSHETPPATPRRNVVRERLEFERQRSGKPLAGTDPARLQEISASDPTVDPNLERLSKMGFRQDIDQFAPKTNAGPLGLVPSHGPAPPSKVSLGRKAADFVGIGGATTAQAALTGVGQMLGGAADTGRSLGDVGAMAFTDEAGDPRLTGDDFAGRKPGSAAPVTWGSGGPVGRGLDWARQTLREAGDQVADSPKVLEAKRVLSQVESGEIGDVVPTLLENPNAIAALGGSAAGSLIPQIAAATVTPGLAVAPMFFQELAGIEEQQRAHEQETGQNMDPLERFGRQAGSSAAIAALERIVPGEIAGALKGRAGGAARALMTPLKEGATEAAQRGIADYFATEEGQLNPAGMLMEGIAGGMGGAAVAPAHMGPAYEGPEVKGRDYGDEFLKHRKNVAAYKAAREKSAAQEKYTAGREELGKLEDQLQAVVNQAGETQDPKAAKAAAALKQKADSLRVELGQVQLAPLSQEDELWIARGAPKFGDALGGGATEAASVEGRAIRGTDENGRPLRLGYSIDEVEAKLSQWREVDPKLGTTNVVVHDSILSPDFFDGLTPEVQERVKRAIANGIDPAELSARSPIPGFYRNGETHVLAPALISLDHLNELVSGHELTHDVIDNLQPDEVVQLFGRGGKAKALGALARRAKKKDQLGYTVGREYADEAPEVQGEEVLAGATEYAGTRGPASRLDRARAAVKDRLRAALPDWAQGVLGAASDAEIRVLLDRTRQIAAKRAKSGSVTVAGRGPQKATAPTEGKAPSLTQLGQAINDAIPDAVALEAAMRDMNSSDPATQMRGMTALLALPGLEVPPGMKVQPKVPAQQPQAPTRQQAQPLPEPSVDVDEMLATQEANDRARLQAERDEAAARADAAEKALKVLEAQRKAEQDQKAKDAKAAKDAEAGRAVLEQLPDEEARRAEEARTQRLLDAARSGDVDPSGALTPAIHQFLGQDAMDRVLANPLGPETPRTKSLKKQPPGTAPTEAVPPTTVPPAAGELQPEAPTGKAPKKGGKARLSIRGGIYEGQERRQERDRRIADVLRKSPDQLTREDILALHEHASENPKSGLPSEAVWNARDHTGKHISVIDVDGLGYLNDKHGFDAGDAMLQAVGHVSRVVKDRHPGVEHYHISGDEFRAEAGSREEADAYSDDLRETLKKTRFLITDGRGVRHVVTGLSTSHGVDITPELADRQMKGDTDDATLQPNSKRARQLRGERAAKGERPPGVTVDPLEGRAGSAPGVLGLATRSDQDRRDRDAGAADEVGTPVKHSRRQEETPEFRAWSRGAPVVDLSGTRPRERLARESRQGEIRDDLGARAQRAKEWLGRDKGPEEASRYTALGYDFYAQELARNGGDEQAALGATIDLGYTPPTKGMSREEAMRQDVESHELERQGHQEAVDRWRAVEDDAKGNPPNANTLVETGKPVVLPAFHGTTSAGFAAFSKKMLGRETGAPSAKEAFFFTSQPDLANVYAKEGDTRGNVYGHVRGSGVYKTYVRMENPLVVDDAGRGRTPGMGYYGHIAEAKRQGRDGVIFLNTYDGGQEEAHVFAVFDNKQVKSALGNVGAFGQRAPTPEEAASLGMTWRGAKAAQTRGDIRFSMRGASAQDADHKKLKTAQKMILAGQDEEEVRKETGWHQGTDKRWRWEGDDSQARIIMEGYRKIPYVADPGKNDGVPLDSVLQYDSMYRSYPEVADIRVVNAPRPIGSTVASFNEKTNVITLFPAVDGFEGGPLQAFLHEVQHWVQTKEAFAAGGNADTVLELIPPEDTKKIAEDAAVRILKQSNYHRDNVAALEEVIRGYEYHRTDEGSRVSVENVPDALGMSEAGKRRYLAATRWGKSTGDLERDLSDERRSIANIESRAEAIRTATGEELKKVVEQYGDAHDYYLRLAGEEEARQTQKRANLTPAERAERDPRLDFDNPPERQIVDMRRGGVRRSRRNSAESQISWEALPGKKTGWLRGIHAAPYEVRAAFTTDMDSKVLRDSMGRDRIARLFGVEETEQLVAPGYWKGERNPSRQLFVRVPDTPDGLERVKAYAAARGYVLRQEGVGFHLARNPNPGETPNGYHADMGRMPTSSEYADFIAGINKAATPKEKESGAFVPVPTHAGINLWTWDGDITPERLREVYEAAAANVKSGATATLHPLVVDSELIENDWLDKGKNGEDYVQRYSATEGSPGVQSSLDQLRKAADKVGREWASRHGWGTRLGSPEPAVPGDLERLVGRDVNPALKGQRRAKLFKDIARLIDGRALADMKFAAESGRAMKGWYRESWQSIRKLFGDDADRFTGLLAALSPQQGVKENLKMAVEAWQLWTDAGKPTDPAAVKALFPVIGRKWSAAQQRWINQYATVDMGARFNNAITALTDPGTPLSGDKVESFRRNLSGDFDAVTNDTWMAYFNDWEQKVFGSNSGYLAGSYLVRRAAKKLGWTPAEVQETVWTFFRELSNRADSRGVSAMDEMATMTQGDVVANADSFAHLVRDPDVKKRLLGLGLDPDNLPDLPRLSAEEAAAPAVGPEDRATGVSRRVAGRAQRQNDRSWARGEIERAGIDGLNDADPAALRKLADAVGIPVKGRTRNQLVAALRTYADPAKYSRRLSDDPDWDLPLTPPQVEARVARLGAVEDSLAADKPGYEVKRLEREKDRPWTKVGPEAEKLDLVTDDDQWVRLASRKGRVLSDTEQQAINSRVQQRHDEMKTLVEKLEEATALSKDEAAARGIDMQALVKEEMAARLAYVAMERASVNAGTQAGRALAARRRIMAAGSDVTPDAMLRRIIKELPDVDKADAADLYRVYHQSPAEFTNALRLVMKPGAFRKGMEYWKAGLLSGLGTHVANVAGNTIEPAAQLAETLVAAGIDKAWSARTGKPRERFVGEARYELRGQLKALPMAFSRFVDEFKAQILRQEEPDISAAGPLEYQVGAIGPGWGVIPFDVGKAVRTPFRALTISDRFFKALGYEAELYKLAYRQARKDGFVGEKADQRADQIIESARENMGDHWRSMVEQADEGMKQRVFQGEPIKIIRSLMTLTREHPAAGFVFPFLRTPAEITRRGWQRSPMGLVGGRRGATSAEYDRQQAGLEAKGGNVVGKGEVSDAWARPLVGTALATAFSGLAAIGMLTGGGPVDKDKKKLKLATGWQPYSVRIPKGGGKYLYLPYTRFEPLSSLLGIVADAFETGDERKVGDKIMGSIAQNYTNKQFWKGLNDFATAITSPDRSAKTVITPIVASALVPAVVAKTAEAIDPTFREKRSDPGLTGLAESTARATLRRIPGVSRGEEPIYTPLGDPAQRPGNAVTRFASPVQPSTTKAGTELEDWLVKINEAPSPIPGEVAIPKELLPRGGEYDQTGTRIVLTNEERAILAKSRRDAASILRRDLESIKRMPLDDQRDRIQKAFKGAQREAISKLWLRSQELRERARKQVGARR